MLQFQAFGGGGGIENSGTIEELDFACLKTLLGPTWQREKPLHLDFSDPIFELTTLKIKENAENTAFAPLGRSKVVTIDISRNKLTTLGTIQGEDFPSLRILRCKANNLLTHGVCLVLPRLKELYLGRNQLTQIPPLSGMPNLEILMLNYNRIQTEQFGKDICKAKELKKVDLRGNMISNNPNNLLKSLVKISVLTNLNFLKLSENPFCPLFPEYQAIVYGFLICNNIYIKQLDHIPLEGLGKDGKIQYDLGLIRVYEDFVSSIVLPSHDHFKYEIIAGKLINASNGKVMVDSEVSSAILPQGWTLASFQAAQNLGLRDQEFEWEKVSLEAGDLLLLDKQLLGFSVDQLLVATSAALSYPLTIRFLHLSKLNKLFEERLEKHGAVQSPAGNMFGALKGAMGMGGNKQASASKIIQQKLPQLTDLCSYNEEAIQDPSSVMQQLELNFRLANKIAIASQDEYPEIYGREKMTRFQLQRHLKTISAEALEELQKQEKLTTDAFIHSINRVHDHYCGPTAVAMGRSVPMVASVLFRTLAKLAVVQGPGSGDLGAKCLIELAELGKTNEKQVLDLLEEAILPELEKSTGWSDPLAQCLVKGLCYFCPPEPYFRGSILVTQSLIVGDGVSYFSGKLKIVTKMLCQFFQTDKLTNSSNIDATTRMHPSVSEILKHCLSNRENAQLDCCKEILPDMLLQLFTHKEIHPDEPNRHRRKIFCDYLKITIYMLLYNRYVSVRKLMPLVDLFVGYVQQLGRAGNLIDLDPIHAYIMSLLSDVICLFIKLSPEVMSAFCEASSDVLAAAAESSSRPAQNQTEKFGKHLQFLIDQVNVQIAEPCMLTAGLRTLYVICSGNNIRYRQIWMEESVRSTVEKPAGLLELILPYLGGMKFKPLYEASYNVSECLKTIGKEILNGDEPSVVEVGKKKKNMAVAPPLATCNDLYMLEAFIAIIDFIKVFTMLSSADPFCERISEELNKRGREKILFSLLSIPDAVVQESVMACIRCVKLNELEEEEIAFLVNMLDVTNVVADVSQQNQPKPKQGGKRKSQTEVKAEVEPKLQERLLFAVINQLRDLVLQSDGGGNAASECFRSKYVEKTVHFIFEIMYRNLKRVTTTREEALLKHKLSFGCLDFIITVSKQISLRNYLRNKKLMMQFFPRILKYEEQTNDQCSDQDVFLERSWAGRSLAALLSTLTHNMALAEGGSGPGAPGMGGKLHPLQLKLSAKKKQAFRIFMRIADVLEGRPDSFENLNELKFDVGNGVFYVELLALREKKMWDEQRIRKQLLHLDDIEWEDRVTQHQAFGSFHGLELMLAYLETELGLGHSGDDDSPCSKRLSMSAEVGGVDPASGGVGTMTKRVSGTLTDRVGAQKGQAVKSYEKDFGLSKMLAAQGMEADREIFDQRKYQVQLDEPIEVNFPIEPPDTVFQGGTNTTSDHFLTAFLETVTTDTTFPEYHEQHKSYYPEGSQLESILSRTDPYNECPTVLTNTFDTGGGSSKKKTGGDAEGPDKLVGGGILNRDAGLNINVLVACYFRAIFVMLKFPCAYNLKKEVANYLRMKVTMQRLIRLMSSLDSLTDFHVVSKFLRVVCLAYKLEASDFEIFQTRKAENMEKGEGGHYTGYMTKEESLANAAAMKPGMSLAKPTSPSHKGSPTIHGRGHGHGLGIGHDPWRAMSAPTGEDPHHPVLGIIHYPPKCDPFGDLSLGKVDVLFMWSNYLHHLLAMLTPKFINVSHAAQALTDEQEVMSIELIASYHTIARIIPLFDYSRYLLSQLKSLNTTFYQFFKPAIDNLIAFAVYDLHLDAGAVSGPRISTDFAHSTNRRVLSLDLLGEVLARCMKFSSRMKYEIIEKFNSNHANSLRMAFVAQLLHNYQMDLYASSVEILLNYQEAKILLQPCMTERMIHFVEVEFPAKSSAYYDTSESTHYLLCITTSRICLLKKDISRSFYYTHSIFYVCGICPSQAFCPKVPSVVFEFTYDRLTRIVDGVGENIALGWLTEGQPEKVEIIGFKSGSVTGKRRILADIQALSSCGWGGDAMVEISEDVITECCLINKTGVASIVAAMHAECRKAKNADIPTNKSGSGISTAASSADEGAANSGAGGAPGGAVKSKLLDLANSVSRYASGGYENSLIVITEGDFFEFTLDWSSWVAPFDAGDDDGQVLLSNLKNTLQGRKVPKLPGHAIQKIGDDPDAHATLIMNKKQGSTDEIDIPKRTAERNRVNENTAWDAYMNKRVTNSNSVGDLQQAREQARKVFISQFLKASPANKTQSANLFGGGGEKEVTQRDMKKRVVTYAANNLLKVKFHASLTTLHSIEIGTTETCNFFMRFQDVVLELKFSSDSSREIFRRGMALVLNQEDAVWKREWASAT